VFQFLINQSNHGPHFCSTGTGRKNDHNADPNFLSIEEISLGGGFGGFVCGVDYDLSAFSTPHADLRFGAYAPGMSLEARWTDAASSLRDMGCRRNGLAARPSSQFVVGDFFAVMA